MGTIARYRSSGKGITVKVVLETKVYYIATMGSGLSCEGSLSWTCIYNVPECFVDGFIVS